MYYLNDFTKSSAFGVVYDADFKSWSVGQYSCTSSPRDRGEWDSAVLWARGVKLCWCARVQGDWESANMWARGERLCLCVHREIICLCGEWDFLLLMSIQRVRNHSRRILSLQYFAENYCSERKPHSAHIDSIAENNWAKSKKKFKKGLPFILDHYGVF